MNINYRPATKPPPIQEQVSPEPIRELTTQKEKPRHATRALLLDIENPHREL